MKNIRIWIKEYFVGNWYIEDLKLSVKITAHDPGLRYLFEYSRTINDTEEELTEILYGRETDHFIHISNSWGIWMLNFINENEFQVLDKHPINQSIREYRFKRKK